MVRRRMVIFKEKYLIELTKESCIKSGAKEILDLLKQVLTENSYLREVYDWGNVYRVIKTLN